MLSKMCQWPYFTDYCSWNMGNKYRYCRCCSFLSDFENDRKLLNFHKLHEIIITLIMPMKQRRTLFCLHSFEWINNMLPRINQCEKLIDEGTIEIFWLNGTVFYAVFTYQMRYFAHHIKVTMDHLFLVETIHSLSIKKDCSYRSSKTKCVNRIPLM